MRRLLVHRIRELGWRVTEAAKAAGIARQTAYEWLAQYDAEGVGHAIHGDRSKRSRGAGWEVVFVCVDDDSRLAYAEVHPAEMAVLFFRRALRGVESLGVRGKRVLTDNAKFDSSKAFTALCEEAGVRQGFTRPYTPRTNGKAERFIQTLERRWAYRHPYRTSVLRAVSLRPWVTHYKHQRPHRAVSKISPIARLTASSQ